MVVEPGDTCYLEAGEYNHDGLTRTHGTKDAPITITGDSGACIKGSNTQDRALQIAHDYYTVEGICFDGEHGDENVATGIYVLGADTKSTKNGVTSSVTGFKMLDLEIKVRKQRRISLGVAGGGSPVVAAWSVVACHMCMCVCYKLRVTPSSNLAKDRTALSLDERLLSLTATACLPIVGDLS